MPISLTRSTFSRCAHLRDCVVLWPVLGDHAHVWKGKNDRQATRGSTALGGVSGIWTGDTFWRQTGEPFMTLVWEPYYESLSQDVRDAYPFVVTRSRQKSNFSSGWHCDEPQPILVDAGLACGIGLSENVESEFLHPGRASIDLAVPYFVGKLDEISDGVVPGLELPGPY
jgi:hypothetical protein